MRLNTFIRGQHRAILKFYNDVFQAVNVDAVLVPDFEHVRSFNAVKPEPPLELFEASLMRLQDMSSLIMLVQWTIEQYTGIMDQF